MADSDAAGELMVVALIAVVGLACYGGYKAYEEWQSPRSAGLAAKERETQALRAQVSDLTLRLERAKEQIDNTEYELDATHYLTGREMTTDIYRGADALERCQRMAAVLGSSQIYYYYCRTARHPARDR